LRSQLFASVSAALPFLAVRLVYNVLSAYSGFKPQLHKFSRSTGDWRIYLVMSLIMEYVVVFIYIAVGNLVPMSKD
jgi:hypothetical protein